MTICKAFHKAFDSFKQKTDNYFGKNTMKMKRNNNTLQQPQSPPTSEENDKSLDEFDDKTLAPPLDQSLSPISLSSSTSRALKGSVCANNNTNVTNRNEYTESTLSRPILSSSSLSNSPVPSPSTSIDFRSLVIVASEKLKNDSNNHQQKSNETSFKIDFHQTVNSRKIKTESKYFAVNPILEPATVPNECTRAVKFNSIVAYREYSYTEVTIKSSNAILRFLNRIFHKWTNHDRIHHKISYVPLAKSKEFYDEKGKNRLMNWWEEVLQES